MWQYITDDPLIALTVFENDLEGFISSLYPVDGVTYLPIPIGKMTDEKITALIDAFKVKT